MSLEGKATAESVLRGKINSLDVLTIDAYGVAVRNGFEGTEEEWLASLGGDVQVIATELGEAEAMRVNGVVYDGFVDHVARGEAARAIEKAKEREITILNADDVNTVSKHVPRQVNNLVGKGGMVFYKRADGALYQLLYSSETKVIFGQMNEGGAFSYLQVVCNAIEAGEYRNVVTEGSWDVAESGGGTGGGIIVTDDGEGNVTITNSAGLSITDDGNGNVVIV